MSRILKSIGISGYKILSQTRNGDCLEVDLQAPKKRAPVCTRCSSTRIQSKGTYERRVRHLECFGHSSRLRIRCRRFRCRDCKSSFLQQLPGILPGKHSSQPFRENVYTLHHEGISSSATGRLKKLGPATVSRIDGEFTQRKASERLSLNCPLMLGIDEHTLHKNRQFATTFCDLGNHRIFDIVEANRPPSWRVFFPVLSAARRLKWSVSIYVQPIADALKPWQRSPKSTTGTEHPHPTSGWELLRKIKRHSTGVCHTYWKPRPLCAG